MRTTVVNIKRETYDVFIGRPSIFGNPYIIDRDGTREEVIELYRKYFLVRVARDEQFRGRVLILKGKRLGCYCEPLPCHGDVIVEYLEGGNAEGVQALR